MVIGSDPFMKHKIPSTKRKKYQCLEYHKCVFLLPNISSRVTFVSIYRLIVWNIHQYKQYTVYMSI